MLLCDSARPFENKAAQDSGGTASWSNLYTAAAMSQSVIDAMRLQGRKMVDEHGRRRGTLYTEIIAPADLESTIVAQLESAQKPGSSLNDINYLKRYNLTYQIWKDLSSTTAFFMRAKKDAKYEVYWDWRKQPNYHPWEDPSHPRTTGYYVHFSFAQGAARPHAVIGNAGA
jgi:hypothetical protein